jgi:hypothetical protein
MPKYIACRLLLAFGIAASTAGCTNAPAPPPALPELEAELPGPPPDPKPAVVDQVELKLLSEDGDEIEEIDPSTPFRAILRFHLVEPPERGLTNADVQLVIYSKGQPIICWQNVGPLVPEGNDIYRYEAEMTSSPYRRQHFVRMRFIDEKEFIIEKPLQVR